MTHFLLRIHREDTLREHFGGNGDFASSECYLRHIQLPLVLEKRFGKLYVVDEVSHQLLQGKPLEAYFLLRDEAERSTREYYRTTNQSHLSFTLWRKEERRELGEMYDAYLSQRITEHPFFQFYLMGKHTDANLEEFLKDRHKKR